MSSIDQDLDRFVAAQAPVYEEVLRELRSGHKRGHWMWFIFPQLRGLGRSETSRWYGIASLDEAIAYGRHPLLGPRLVECTGIVNGLVLRRIGDLFPSPDDLKFRSSMTLFRQAQPQEPAFTHALETYFSGQPDPFTLRLLG